MIKDINEEVKINTEKIKEIKNKIKLLEDNLASGERLVIHKVTNTNGQTKDLFSLDYDMIIALLDTLNNQSELLTNNVVETIKDYILSDTTNDNCCEK